MAPCCLRTKTLCVLSPTYLSSLFSPFAHYLSLHHMSSVRWLAPSCPLLTLCLLPGSASLPPSLAFSSKPKPKDHLLYETFPDP